MTGKENVKVWMKLQDNSAACGETGLLVIPSLNVLAPPDYK